MADQNKNATAGNGPGLSPEFIAVAALAFAGAVLATVYFCRSMCCERSMPGGWTMSTIWMRMPGQSWFGSASSFLLMWLAMMVAMMLPSALPMFLGTRRPCVSLLCMASGYFGIWVAAGAGLYGLGVAFAGLATRSEFFSRMVPILSSAVLLAAGALQFTRWKMAGLLRCRSALGCAGSGSEETSFRLGCRQGVACCACCAAPMLVLIALGMMNPLVMIGVTVVIAAEKLLPRPALVARIVGLLAIAAAIATLAGLALSA